MWRNIIRTPDDRVLTLLRLALGIVVFPHGAQKVLGRIAAFGIAVNFTVAALIVHLPNGFFMNWSGQQKGEGVEFFILVIAMAIAVLIRGSGAWSIDRLISRDRPRSP